MKSKYSHADIAGFPLELGDLVEVCEVPDWLLAGLLPEDQAAIRQKIGAKVEIAGFDDYGHVELEFNQPKDAPRTIWIDPQCLRKVS